MIFRRLVLCAVAIGIIAGTLLGIGEQFSTAPLIEAAEQYEQPHHHEAGAAHAHDHDHHGDSTAWAPSDGGERIFFTILANIGVAIGFALLLLVAMSLARMAHGASTAPITGLAWGGAAYLVVFVAPALGLPPEVPGTAAAGLASRQAWWIATVLVVGVALWIAVFAPNRYKGSALFLAPLPYLFGAPEPAGSMYAGHDKAATAALETIHQQFVYATASVNGLLWLVLGLACMTAMRVWLAETLAEDESHATASL